MAPVRVDVGGFPGSVEACPSADPVDDESAAVPLPVSAAATAGSPRIAPPTPSATAKVPIRPT